MAIVVLVGVHASPEQSIGDVWREYVALALVLSAGVMVSLLLEKRSRAVLLAVHVVLAVACVLSVGGVLISRVTLGLVLLVIMQVIHLWRTRSSHVDATMRAWLTSLPIRLFVSLTAWFAALTFVWWAGGHDIQRRPWVIVMVVAAFILIESNLPYERQDEPLRPMRAADRRLTVIGCGVLAVMGFRNGWLFDYPSFHHWGFYAGPSDLVRHGHWLLWDVPAQYGFLSSAVIAFFPVTTVWTSLFVVSAVLTGAMAIVLFLALRSIKRGWSNGIFALLLTASAVYLRYYPDPAPRYPGPGVYPSTGGLRYAWLVVLLGVVLKLSEANGPSRVRWFTIGCAVWLVGTLWSLESAVFCGLVWLPICVFLVGGDLIAMRKRGEVSDWRGLLAVRQHRSALSWLVIPAGSLAVAVTATVGYYLVRVGSLPDWRVFTDSASAYGEGLKSFPLDLGGPVWVLIVLLRGFTTAASGLVRSHPGSAIAI